MKVYRKKMYWRKIFEMKMYHHITPFTIVLSVSFSQFFDSSL